MNTLGQLFRITSFGESHGKCTGIVVDGCPPGIKIKERDIQKELDKRKPGQSNISTQRKEKDKVEILSGIFNGFTTGAPICLLTQNKDVDSSSYEKMKNLMRPGHADFTAFLKYKGFNDYRGGGRFSGRNTIGFVMAGAIAKKVLKKIKIETLAHTIQIGKLKAKESGLTDIKKNVYQNDLRCADLKSVKKLENLIYRTRQEKDSIGGIIEGIVLNAPTGLGEPIFDTLEGEIAKALFSIPGVKGIEFGLGFKSAEAKGSQNNDFFQIKKRKITTKTNNSGGILGGISNGMPIVVKLAIKPTPSISKKQKTIDVRKGENKLLEIQGRHDPCIVPRAVPVVENMLAVTILDFALRAKIIK